MRRPAWLTREVWGWALFDFANQAFTIVILTVMFQLYFTRHVVPGGEEVGRRWWAISGIITQIVLALSGPLVGALADFSGVKKRLLFVTWIGACLFCLALAFVQPGQALLGASLFIVAYLFYGAGENLLSAFLPELADHRDMGRVSAFSWTIAYIGAMLALLGANALIAIVPGAQLHIESPGGSAVDETTPLGFQIATGFAAVFFLVAGLFLFLWVPERHYPQPLPPGQTLWSVGFHRTLDTLTHLRRFRQLFRFLAIMTFFFAGMQAIYWFGATVARELFGLSDDQIVGFMLLATVVGIPGAALAGPVQDRLGSRNTLMGLLLFWAAVVLLAAGSGSAGAAWQWLAWPVACLVGLGIGGLGTAARATVGLFSPPQRAAEFFGFYGIAHKVSAIVGLGWMSMVDWMAGGRFTIVVASLSVFFIGGMLLLLFVDEREGRVTALRAAKRFERESDRRGETGDAERETAEASPDPRAAFAVVAPPASQVVAGPDEAGGAAEEQKRARQFIELDNNATTRPAEEVIEAMLCALREGWHNPSSVHRPGQAARHAVETARASVARLIGAGPREVVFTSGGTEAANLAVVGSLDVYRTTGGGRPVLVTSRLEHSAVRELAEALAESGRAEVIWLQHERQGLVDLAALEELLTRRGSEIALVSLMWANNETGLIQPIAEVGRRCRAAGVRVHTDATQWVGRMPTKVAELPIDLLSFAAHKFHGPKGVGALWIRRGIHVAPQLIGGPQELERRGGTENTPGIVGMGVAAELARRWLEGTERERLAALRDRFERGVLEAVPDAVVNAAGLPRLWNTSSIGVPRLEAEAILLLLSERGLCSSAGAACSSGSLEPSPVLLAMGVPPEIAHGSVRFSLSRETTEDEIDRAIEIVRSAILRLRRSGGG
jgi:cysteine desulfurase